MAKTTKKKPVKANLKPAKPVAVRVAKSTTKK